MTLFDVQGNYRDFYFVSILTTFANQRRRNLYELTKLTHTIARRVGRYLELKVLLHFRIH